MGASYTAAASRWAPAHRPAARNKPWFVCACIIPRWGATFLDGVRLLVAAVHLVDATLCVHFGRAGVRCAATPQPLLSKGCRRCRRIARQPMHASALLRPWSASCAQPGLGSSVVAKQVARGRHLVACWPTASHATRQATEPQPHWPQRLQAARSAMPRRWPPSPSSNHAPRWFVSFSSRSRSRIPGPPGHTACAAGRGRGWEAQE